MRAQIVMLTWQCMCKWEPHFKYNIGGVDRGHSIMRWGVVTKHSHIHIIYCHTLFLLLLKWLLYIVWEYFWKVSMNMVRWMWINTEKSTAGMATRTGWGSHSGTPRQQDEEEEPSREGAGSSPWQSAMSSACARGHTHTHNIWYIHILSLSPLGLAQQSYFYLLSLWNLHLGSGRVAWHGVDVACHLYRIVATSSRW